MMDRIETRHAYVLVAAPVGQEDLRPRLLEWFGNLPTPLVFEMQGRKEGARVRVLAGGGFSAAADAFAALTRHACHWAPDPTPPAPPVLACLLTSDAVLPQVFSEGGDPFLIWGARLRATAARYGFPVGLAVVVLGPDPETQAALRALVAYNYGSSAGVDADEPNPWALRLTLYRGLALSGGLVTATAAGAWAAGWAPAAVAMGLIAAGGLSFLAGALGVRRWLEVRNVPREVMEAYTRTPLFRAALAFTAYGDDPVAAREALNELAATAPLILGQRPLFVAGDDLPAAARAAALPLPADVLARLLTPPQGGDPAAILDPESRSDVPAPPPVPDLRRGRFYVGRAAATREPVAVNLDGHGLICGGSGSGKSSLAARLLHSLLEDPDPPGLVLVDPHLSLADAFLDAAARLPGPLRDRAVRRLRVLSPDMDVVVPLNLLSLPDHTWAANALISAGRRIWTDYWGPRMQAALNALFNLAHAYNQKVSEGRRLSLFHLPFLAFNPEKRHEMLAYLPPERRVITLSLDALLGQFADENRPWMLGWITEVVSPVISKLMALELSPWLVMAMAHPRFADLMTATRERAWFVVRAPSGTMGREGARLMAAVFYNVWESVFRRVASAQDPIPYVVVVDELQEVGPGMRLEALLAEGGKFGARVVALTQSLRMLYHEEEMRPVVQALKANTSLQAFFSPDPDDAADIRNMLSSELRYGEMTLDLPVLHCWLRERKAGRWQPPTVVQVPPLPPADPARVQALLAEVVAAHPDFYAAPTIGAEALVNAMLRLVPPDVQALLGRLLDEDEGAVTGPDHHPHPPPPREETEHERRMRRLGL